MRVCAICAIVAFRVEIDEAENEFVFGAHGGELAPSAFRLQLNEALRVVASVDIITMGRSGGSGGWSGRDRSVDSGGRGGSGFDGGRRAWFGRGGEDGFGG